MHKVSAFKIKDVARLGDIGPVSVSLQIAYCVLLGG